MARIIWHGGGSGGGGGTTFWTANGDDIYNNNAGNVGVGTSTPQTKLEVVGDSTVTGRLFVNSGDSNIKIGVSNMNTVRSRAIAIGQSISLGNESVGIGEGVSYLNSYSHYSVLIGRQVGYYTSGISNTAIGYQAAKGTTGSTFSETTALGYRALTTLTTGTQNTAVGYNALLSARTALRGVAIGHSAMASLLSGTANIAIGHAALFTATDTENNIAIGREASYYNLGIRNVFVGTQSGRGALGSDTDYNVGIGYQPLYSVTDGSRNVAIGAFSATALTTGEDNVAIGYQSLQNLTTATKTVAIGSLTGGLLSLGGQGVYIGHNARNNDDGALYQVVIGTDAMGTNNYNVAIGRLSQVGYNAVSIGASAGSSSVPAGTVAIGNAAGSQMASAAINSVGIGGRAMYYSRGQQNVLLGYYAGEGVAAESTFENTVAVGAFALRRLTDGTGNIAVGMEAGQNVSRGNHNIAVGLNALNLSTDSSQNIAIGTSALSQASSTQDNIAIGYQAQFDNTGVRNVYLGTEAGKGVAANAADDNVGIGFQTLLSQTTGSRNTAIGAYSADALTTGDDNIAIGYGALPNSTTGTLNIAIGKGANTRSSASNIVAVGHLAAGSLAGGGGGHVFVGNNAGENSFGSSNVAVGIRAMDAYSNGSNNVAVGADALGGLINGANENTAVGHRALLTYTGSFNTAIGAYALDAATTGEYNTAVGHNALTALTTGVRNVVIGNDAEKFRTSASDNVTIGANARAGTSGGGGANISIGSFAASGNFGTGSVAIGHYALSTYANSGSNVAIGYYSLQNSTAAANTAVGYETALSLTTATGVTAIGYQSQRSVTTGGQNTSLGHGSLQANTTGTNNTAIGYGAGQGAVGSGNVFLGHLSGSTETGSNRLYVANSATTTPLLYGEFDTPFLRVNAPLSSQTIAVGKTTASSTLDVLGDGTIEGNFAVRSVLKQRNAFWVQDDGINFLLGDNANSNQQVSITRDGSTSTDVVALKIGSNITIKRNGGGTPSFSVGNAGFIYSQNYNGNTATNTNPFNNGAGMGIRNTNQGSTVICALYIKGAFGAVNTAGSSMQYGNVAYLNAGWSRTQSNTFQNSNQFAIRYGTTTDLGSEDGYLFWNSAIPQNNQNSVFNGTSISNIPNFRCTTNGAITATNGSNILDSSPNGATIYGGVEIGDSVYVMDSVNAVFNASATPVRYTITDKTTTTLTLDRDYTGTSGTKGVFVTKFALTVREWDKTVLTRVKPSGLQIGTDVDGYTLPNLDGETNQTLVTDGEGNIGWGETRAAITTIPVRNNTASTLPVGAIVQYAGTQGDHILVQVWDNASPSAYLVGIMEEELAAGADGHAMSYGELRNIDTSMYALDTVLYAGVDGFTTTANSLPIATVTRVHENTGRIFVRLWVSGDSYRDRYRSESEQIGRAGAVETYYSAQANGDGFYQDRQPDTPVNPTHSIIRRIFWKSGSFEALDATGYTEQSYFDITYAELLAEANAILSQNSAPITIYSTREEAASFVGILDDYPDATFGVSVNRRLATQYTGALIQVRRASDNAILDIGYTPDNNLDVDALTAFCAGTDGYVVRWYDQSSNGNDAVQATTSAQPQIVASGSVLVDSSGKAVLRFDGIDDYLQTSYNAPITFTAFWSQIPTDGDSGQILGKGTSGRYVMAWSSSNQIILYRNGSVSLNETNTPAHYLGYLLSTSPDTACVIGYNGSVKTGVNAIGSDTLSQMVIGAERSSVSIYGNSDLQEIILYPSNQSSNRSGIETNINNYYNIY